MACTFGAREVSRLLRRWVWRRGAAGGEAWRRGVLVCGGWPGGARGSRVSQSRGVRVLRPQTYGSVSLCMVPVAARIALPFVACLYPSRFPSPRFLSSPTCRSPCLPPRLAGPLRPASLRSALLRPAPLCFAVLCLPYTYQCPRRSIAVKSYTHQKMARGKIEAG